MSETKSYQPKFCSCIMRRDRIKIGLFLDKWYSHIYHILFLDKWYSHIYHMMCMYISPLHVLHM